MADFFVDNFRTLAFCVVIQIFFNFTKYGIFANILLQLDYIEWNIFLNSIAGSLHPKIQTTKLRTN